MQVASWLGEACFALPVPSSVLHHSGYRVCNSPTPTSDRHGRSAGAEATALSSELPRAQPPQRVCSPWERWLTFPRRSHPGTHPRKEPDAGGTLSGRGPLFPFASLGRAPVYAHSAGRRAAGVREGSEERKLPRESVCLLDLPSPGNPFSNSGTPLTVRNRLSLSRRHRLLYTGPRSPKAPRRKSPAPSDPSGGRQCL